MEIIINKVLGTSLQSPVRLHVGICLRAEKYREGNKKKKKIKKWGKYYQWMYLVYILQFIRLSDI